MGILAPLYLAGLAALSLPLIFHLVRRTPKGRQEFSSLMFLLPSPPRLTRRSRIDQLLLLLLRLAALALLAFAFARPFLREAATLALQDLPARRVALLVDNSASMRRGDLWQQALAQVDRELDDLSPHDQVALYTFGDTLKTEVGFEAGEADAAASRVEIVRGAAKKLRPTWRGTDLAAALVAVAGELDAKSDVEQQAAQPQIIVISDFQKSAKLDALQAFEWPERVHVVTRPLSPKRPTNAAVQLLVSDEEIAASELRVRVVNAANSRDDQFFVRWTSDEAEHPTAGQSAKQAEIAVYVPPGESRVVKLPRPENLPAADRIVLRGDDDEFDNTHYVVPPRKQEVRILYVGTDAADDESGPRFYLELAAAGDALRQVTIEPMTGAAAAVDATEARLAVVTSKLSAGLAEALQSFAKRGGTVVLAPASSDAAGNFAALLEDVELNPQAKSPGDFQLLGEIDFSHPLFVPFANPRYSDFTKIHFWKHTPLNVRDGSQTRVVARFDSGEPAILERDVGSGRVVAFASGWHPEQSQLALSSKFVPLIGALLDRAVGATAGLAGVVIGGRVSLPAAEESAGRTVVPPDGKPVELRAEDREFNQTDQPGIYRLTGAGEDQAFAVNLSATESNTAPLELEQLDQLGVRTKAILTKAERLARIRQQRDTELESRQKIWRWLIVAVLGVLVIETTLAGRAARQIAKQEAGYEQTSTAV